MPHILTTEQRATQAATHAALVEALRANPCNIRPSALNFARSLVQSFAAYGNSWTPRQAEFAARLVSEATPAPAPVEIGDGLARIHALFATARANGLRTPRLTVDGVQITPSRSNPDALNIRANGLYAGTLAGGIFRPRASAGNAAEVLNRLAADPARALTAHGHATGRCGVCTRTLSDPVSVAMGIGPICAARFGISRDGVTPAPTAVTSQGDTVTVPVRAPRIRRATIPAEAHALVMNAQRAHTLTQQAANVRNRYAPLEPLPPRRTATGRVYGDDEVIGDAY